MANKLLEFMRPYLKNLEKRDLFDNQELSEHCRQLLEMLGRDTDITVMLAKLYADKIIAVKTNTSSDNVPKNIPEVILRYLNELNERQKKALRYDYNRVV